MVREKKAELPECVTKQYCHSAAAHAAAFTGNPAISFIGQRSFRFAWQYVPKQATRPPRISFETRGFPSPSRDGFGFFSCSRCDVLPGGPAKSCETLLLHWRSDNIRMGTSGFSSKSPSFLLFISSVFYLWAGTVCNLYSPPTSSSVNLLYYKIYTTSKIRRVLKLTCYSYMNNSFDSFRGTA